MIELLKAYLHCCGALAAAVVLAGCKAPDNGTAGAKAAPGSPAAVQKQVALQRAIDEISKIEWISLTNRPYKLQVRKDNHSNYVFTFVMTDAPDQAVSATVWPSRVVLTGHWVPPP